MASDIEICNVALSNIRAGSINSFNEGSLQAQQCSLKYPMMRDMLLAQAQWGFAGKIAPLAELSTTVPHWVYAYQYPADCLQVRQLMYSDTVSPVIPANIIQALDSQIVYKIMNPSGVNRIIVANLAKLDIDYTVKVTDPNLFDDAFIQALSWLMSAELAVPIVGAETGRQLRADALNMYQGYLSSAITDSLNERYTPPRDSDFITVRQ